MAIHDLTLQLRAQKMVFICQDPAGALCISDPQQVGPLIWR